VPSFRARAREREKERESISYRQCILYSGRVHVVIRTSCRRMLFRSALSICLLVRPSTRLSVRCRFARRAKSRSPGRISGTRFGLVRTGSSRLLSPFPALHREEMRRKSVVGAATGSSIVVLSCIC
jgi:hypothetical protein